MRQRWLRVLGSVGLALAVGLCAAVSAQAAPPTLVSAGHASRHLVAKWTLPPGVDADEVEYSHSPATSSDGSFSRLVDTEVLDDDQTSWRSDEVVSPGIYYVHVSGMDIECDNCAIEEWSNAIKVVVPVPIPRPGRYRGRTSPDGKAISFWLSRDLKFVNLLTFSYELQCSFGGRLLGTVAYRTPIRVNRDGSFSRLIHYPLRFRGGPSGSATITFKGRLRPPTAAGGTVRARAALSGGVRCSDVAGSEEWSAVRR